jgi:hypothetical protein
VSLVTPIGFLSGIHILSAGFPQDFNEFESMEKQVLAFER